MPISKLASMSINQDELLKLAYQPEVFVQRLTQIFDQRDVEQFDVAINVADLPTLARLEVVGFQTGRQFSQGKLRMQRLRLSRLDFIRALAENKISEFLDPAIWSFSFDSAKRRAGLCDYTNSKISLSKYFAEIHSIDECEQVILHEIAHGICGKRAGHTKKWLSTAKSIGYRAEQFTGKEIAAETARWVGLCPSGHAHYRYRRPTRPTSCAICSKTFSARYLISWRDRG
ncbi:MAG: hypothetical protein RIR16_970 [Actinomycetota bacterium]|jgi:predicted SprT family Zn-dependent metalloprotease